MCVCMCVSVCVCVFVFVFTCLCVWWFSACLLGSLACFSTGSIRIINRLLTILVALFPLTFARTCARANKDKLKRLRPHAEMCKNIESYTFLDSCTGGGQNVAVVLLHTSG